MCSKAARFPHERADSSPPTEPVYRALREPQPWRKYLILSLQCASCPPPNLESIPGMAEPESHPSRGSDIRRNQNVIGKTRRHRRRYGPAYRYDRVYSQFDNSCSRKPAQYFVVGLYFRRRRKQFVFTIVWFPKRPAVVY